MPAPGDHSITSNKLKRKSPDGPQDLDLDSAFKKLKGAVHTVQESIHDKDKVVGELRSQIDRLERKILDYQQELDEGHIAKLQTKMNGMEEEMKKLKADKFRARFDRGQAERSLVSCLCRLCFTALPLASLS